MPGPFDYINSINTSKEDILTEEKDYPAFMVNKSLSYFPDTIFYANEMNVNWQLPERMQYDFLRAAIRPRKRFSKWFKETKNPDLEAVKEYYGYNTRNALFALRILSKEDVANIKEKLNRGGKK